jgi:large subunit ribosomal protein L24
MKHVKKKDKVIVLTGKDKGKIGEVIKTVPDKNFIYVAKVNLIKKHVKPTRTDPGGIREMEGGIHVSKVMLICPKCERPNRPKFDFLSDGKKVRICRKCGEMII